MISAHAPVEDAPYDCKREFYEALEEELITAGKACQVTLLCIDANGTTGEVQSLSTGQVGAQKESENGNLLRVLCDACELSLINTWMGGDTSYPGTYGHCRRIDYVAISSCCKDAAVQSWKWKRT